MQIDLLPLEPVWRSDGRATTCERCGEPISNARLQNQAGRTLFCSGKCQRASYREKHRDRVKAWAKAHPNTKIDTTLVGGALSASDVGALNELLACADLMKRGFTVFRAVSPGASCDLLVTSGSRVWRVEVRTARRHKSGTSYSTHGDPSRWDVLAMVFQDGSVAYRPEWPKES